MDAIPPEVEKILLSAKEYKQLSSKAMTHRDYEKFKRQLHAVGAYGYERDLAEILEV